jgi:hypothetical protein
MAKINECKYKNCSCSKQIQTQSKIQCNFCEMVYCSLMCRHNDWTRHKENDCISGNISSCCKRLIVKLSRNVDIRLRLSHFALACSSDKQTRGMLWINFDSLKKAFVTKNLQSLSYDSLVKSELKPKFIAFPIDKNSLQLDRQLELLVQNVYVYNLLAEFVLFVTIEVKRCQITDDLYNKQARINRKILNNKDAFYEFEFLRVAVKLDPKPFPVSNEKLFASESTLVLTSFKRTESEENTIESRELFFANSMNQFQARGICLRDDYPSVYENFCFYVEENRSFGPLCLFLRDSIKNRPFLCLIMPDSVQLDFSKMFYSRYIKSEEK